MEDSRNSGEVNRVQDKIVWRQRRVGQGLALGPDVDYVRRRQEAARLAEAVAEAEVGLGGGEPWSVPAGDAQTGEKIGCVRSASTRI